MSTNWTDFDVTLGMGQLPNQGYFQGDYCKTADHRCRLVFTYVSPASPIIATPVASEWS